MPAILQMETAECGAACLAMVLAAFGRHQGLDEVRECVGASRDGTSAAALVEAARLSGLAAEAYSRDVAGLSDLPLPQILFWNFDHFVVLEAIRRDGFVILDPAFGRRRVDRAEFGRCFTGVTLAFAPGPDFKPRPAPPGTLARLAATLEGSWAGFAAIALTSLVTVALGVIVAGFTRVFIDDYLIEGRGDWLIPLVGAMLAVAVLNGAVGALHVHGSLLLQTKITAVLNARMVARLLALPYEVLGRRSAVELSGRGQLAGQIASAAADSLTQGAAGMVGMAVYLAAMIAYSPVLALVVVVLSAVNLLIVRAARPRIEEAACRLQMAAGQAHAANVQAVALLEDHRATGTEAVLFDRLMDASARLISAEQESGRMTRLMAALPFAMSRTITLAVLGVGALQVIGTDLTLGMLMGFLLLSELFSASLAVLAGVGTAVGRSASAFQRVGDLLDRRDEGPAGGQGPEPGRATGALSLRGLAFAYGEGRPVFSGLDLDVAAGEVIAVMGASGAGKSTLCALLAGLLAPTAGSVLYETQGPQGTALEPACTGLGYVDQTPFLPAGTLRAALTLWNPDVTSEALELALADAEMAAVIAGRPGGLDGRIGEGACDFSGGERQRLALARALAGAPRLLLLDDATSALDEATEFAVIENLRRRGATVLLFTNRTSAVRLCDRALALMDGDLLPIPPDHIPSPSLDMTQEPA